MAKKASKKESSVNDGLVCAILSYFLVGIIWYFVDEKMKKNKFVRLHAQQGLALIVISIALMIVSFILPFLGLVWLLANIALFVLWLIGLIKAITGKSEGVPLVEKLAEKFNI